MWVDKISTALLLAMIAMPVSVIAFVALYRNNDQFWAVLWLFAVLPGIWVVAAVFVVRDAFRRRPYREAIAVVVLLAPTVLLTAAVTSPRFFSHQLLSFHPPKELIVQTTTVYSNAGNMREGTSEWAGADLMWARDETRSWGWVVFYESYWGEPTNTVLCIEQVASEDNKARFTLAAGNFSGKYALGFRKSSVALNRIDTASTGPISLGRQTDIMPTVSRIRRLVRGPYRKCGP
jgi:hypothetical protein